MNKNYNDGIKRRKRKEAKHIGCIGMLATTLLFLVSTTVEGSYDKPERFQESIAGQVITAFHEETNSQLIQKEELKIEEQIAEEKRLEEIEIQKRAEAERVAAENAKKIAEEKALKEEQDRIQKEKQAQEAKEAQIANEKKAEQERLASIADGQLPKAHQSYLLKRTQKLGIDYKKALAVMKTESGFNPNVISSTNDYGYFQINKINHARMIQTLGSPNTPLDPYVNIDWGTFMLAELYEYWGDRGVTGTELDEYVWSSYNRGLGGFKKYGKVSQYIQKVNESYHSF